MILKNNLYTIASRSEGDATGASFTLQLQPECFIYAAHFPGEPITPGVCIVQMAKELLEEMLQCPLQIKMVKNVKFLSVLTPDETTEVTYDISKVTHDVATRQVKAQFAVTAAGETKAKVSLVCMPA